MALKRSLLKPLTKAPNEAPKLYIVPGLGGHPLQFRPIASQLLPNIDMVGVLYPPLAGDDTVVETVEELASRMVTAFDDLEGPVILCGHSFGGTVAYEMACQIRRQNRQVGVVLFDTAVGALRRKRGRMYRGVRNIFVAWPLKMIGISKPPSLKDDLPQNLHSIEFRTQCRAAARHYRPPSSDVPIVLIRARARGRYNWLWGRYWPSKDFGWSKVAPVLKVIFCPGNHVTIVHKDSQAGLLKAIESAFPVALEGAANLPATTKPGH